jgi:hypothetical protein
MVEPSSVQQELERGWGNRPLQVSPTGSAGRSTARATANVLPEFDSEICVENEDSDRE